jgi:hypothetical protein
MFAGILFLPAQNSELDDGPHDTPEKRPEPQMMK